VGCSILYILFGISIPIDRCEFIFSEIVKGTTIPKLLKKLNSMGIKTMQGNEFKYNSVQHVINNDAYRGTIASKKTIGQYYPRPKGKWILVHNAHPSIVDKDTWERANKIGNEYSFKAPRSKNRIYPTSNLVFCAICGKVKGNNYHFHIGKFYVKYCKCGNRGSYFNPVLAMIKEQVLPYKEQLLNALETLEDSQQGDTTQFKKDKLLSQLNVPKKALGRINILFEKEEIDIFAYWERKA
jgi:site-specific DNA recombinase